MTGLWAFEVRMPFQKYQGPAIVVRYYMTRLFPEISILKTAYQAWIFADQKFWKGQIVFKHLPIFFPRNLHFPRRDIRIQPFQNIVVKSIMKSQ